MAIERVVPVNGMAEGLTLQHALAGQPVSNIGLANNPGSRPGIEPAGLFSTAPYVDPSISRKQKLLEQRKAAAEEKAESIKRKHCRAKNGTCKGWAGPDGLCRGHSMSAAKGKVIE